MTKAQSQLLNKQTENMNNGFRKGVDMEWTNQLIDVLGKDAEILKAMLLTLPHAKREDIIDDCKEAIEELILNMIGNAQDLVSTLQQDRRNTSQGRFHVEENEFAGE